VEGEGKGRRGGCVGGVELAVVESGIFWVLRVERVGRRVLEVVVIYPS